MFDKLLNKMTSVEASPSILSQPVTLDADGEVVTLRRLVHPVVSFSERDKSILSVRELGLKQLKKVALEAVNQSGVNESLGVVGTGSFSKEQIIKEIESDSNLGLRIVETVRTHALFLEAASKKGAFGSQKFDSLELPAFPF